MRHDPRNGTYGGAECAAGVCVRVAPSASTTPPDERGARPHRREEGRGAAGDALRLVPGASLAAGGPGASAPPNCAPPTRTRSSALRPQPRALPQVGCQMACTFCATGTMGLSRSLTAGEIVEQLARRPIPLPPHADTNPKPRARPPRPPSLTRPPPAPRAAPQVHASRIEPIRNIVFMGAPPPAPIAPMPKGSRPAAPSRAGPPLASPEAQARAADILADESLPPAGRLRHGGAPCELPERRCGDQGDDGAAADRARGGAQQGHGLDGRRRAPGGRRRPTPAPTHSHRRALARPLDAQQNRPQKPPGSADEATRGRAPGREARALPARPEPGAAGAVLWG